MVAMTAANEPLVTISETVTIAVVRCGAGVEIPVVDGDWARADRPIARSAIAMFFMDLFLLWDCGNQIRSTGAVIDYERASGHDGSGIESVVKP